MAERIVVKTDDAPDGGGLFSQAVVAGGLLFTAGQGPLDPGTKTIVGDSIEEQTRATLDNIKAILNAGGTSLDNAVKINVYLSDMKNYDTVNSIYREYFESSPPARTCVQPARLPNDIMVEIEVVAVAPA